MGSIGRNIRTMFRSKPDYTVPQVTDSATVANNAISLPAGVGVAFISAAGTSNGTTDISHRAVEGDLIRLVASGGIKLNNTAISATAFGKMTLEGAAAQTLSAQDEIVFRVNSVGGLQQVGERADLT